MASMWETAGVLDAVLEALESVRLNSPQGHHFGRPFVTSYQLAIKIDDAHPDIRQALGHELGGSGTGAHHSFAQYLGRELSRRIKRRQEDLEAGKTDEPYPVEGRFLSNEHVTTLGYRQTNGKEFVSSVTGTGYDLALFRLRED